MRTIYHATVLFVATLFLSGCNTGSSSTASQATEGLTVPTNISAVPANN